MKKSTTNNNKYVKDYDLSTESLYLMCWGVNNFYEWKMLKKLPVNGFECRKVKFTFDEEFIQDYDEDS